MMTQDWDRSSSEGLGIGKSRGRNRKKRPRAVLPFVLGGVVLSPLSVAVWHFFAQDEVAPEEAVSLFDRPSPAKTAEAFLLAKTVEERLEYVRDPEVIRARFSTFADSAFSESATDLVPLGISPDSEQPTHLYLATMADTSQRLVAAIDTKEGFKVDWDAFVRHGSASWEEIFQAAVEEATVRVLVKPGNHYAHEFLERSEWSAYILATPDAPQVLHGYVKRGSDLEEAIRSNLAAGSLRHTLVIKIDSEAMSHQQIEILGIRARDWVEETVPPGE